MKNSKKYHAVFILFLFCGLPTAWAQDQGSILPQANQQYKDKNFVEAEANYRVSSSKSAHKTSSTYNLGNAIYRQNQASEAKHAYQEALQTAKTATQKHQALHNLGNVFMKEKDYTQAVAAYKNALRNNPSDEETRYNYALAKKMLKENPPKEDQNKKDKDKKDKDKDKDKKDDTKDKDKKEDPKKDGDKDQKDSKNPDQEAPKPQPESMSEQRLKNLLNAVNNEEKKVQDKVNANKVKGKPTKTEKDW
ncbi:tetratricopeptide repeat protein [Flavobacterium crassostreae]|uniref:BatC protein n=1 Tax=Flavobacterium crassostreae TaxID=1763534 RepID=A0A1B9E5S8_9FLAO|nr:tetratricopeptide repeat protein [Flavobacterium crassostreae]OCB77279.1 BatC protein [Flavobacterium crassostreae]